MKESYQRQDGAFVASCKLFRRSLVRSAWLGAAGGSLTLCLAAEGSSMRSQSSVSHSTKHHLDAAKQALSKAAKAKADPSRAPYNFYGQVHLPFQWGKYKDLGASPGMKDRLGDLALCPDVGLMFGNLYTAKGLSVSVEVRALPTWKVQQAKFSKRFEWPNHYFGVQGRYGGRFIGGVGYAGCSAWGEQKKGASPDESGVYLPAIMFSGSYSFAREISGFAAFSYGFPRKLDNSDKPDKSALAPHLTFGARGALVKGIQGTIRGFWFMSYGDNTSIKLPTDFAQELFKHPVGFEFSGVVKLLAFAHLKPFFGVQAFRGAPAKVSAFESTVYGGISLDFCFSEDTSKELDFSSLKKALGFDLKVRGSVREAYPFSPILERWAVSSTTAP